MRNKEQTNLLACRFCGAKTFEVINLGRLPLANSLSSERSPVDTFPTVLHVCSCCATAQLSHCIDLDVLYKNYVYITPESSTLSAHYKMIIEYLFSEKYLCSSAKVLEIGSNIGRFLKHLEPFVQSVTGIDPAENISNMANERGITTLCAYFNADTATRIASNHRMDLIIARHCFAHNEKPWSMLQGVAECLTTEGVFVIENAYFPDTVARGEFDQIYHEHMYYYSARSIHQVAQQFGFKLVDCLHCDIHGGSMLYFVKRAEAEGELSARADYFLSREKEMHLPEYYTAFIQRIQVNKVSLLNMIQQIKDQGKTIYAYGASAKSTTLLNYFGIDATLIPYVVDSTITKVGKYIPMTQIKIISEEEANIHQPDYYLLTIWNYKDEIIKKVRQSGNHKSRFIIPHPVLEIVD